MNPYLVEGPPTTRLSLVAFVDILGFQQLTLDAIASGEQEALLRRLHHALNEARQLLAISSEFDRFAMRTFTDNIVIGWPIQQDGESETGDAFLRFSAFQVEMIRHGFFIRGALTVGDIYVDDIAVFGEGLVEAYRGESTLAQHPRIILCSPLVSLVRQHLRYYAPGWAPQLRILLQDVDGQWFIDYLDDEVFPDVDIVQEEFLSVHKEQIELNLRRFVADPRVWSKYCWIADYHNAFCEMHTDQLTPGLSIDVSLFRSGPRRIEPPPRIRRLPR